MRTNFYRNLNLFVDYNATTGFKSRQQIYLNCSRYSEDIYAQAARIYLGEPIYEGSIEESLDQIYTFEDCMDFKMNALVRMLYLNLVTDVLQKNTERKICDALGKAKYWMTEGGKQHTAYMNTENHQILYHTTELLVGQLFPNDTFPNSGMTGKDHVKHAVPFILNWLEWRAQFGFNEWHSNNYYTEDMAALLNLVDFSLDIEIALKAAMILDIMAFDFANNYFKGMYATTMGRTYDSMRVGGSRDSTDEAVWIMLGIGTHDPCDNHQMAAVNLATSEHYAPPPILEQIAKNLP